MVIGLDLDLTLIEAYVKVELLANYNLKLSNIVKRTDYLYNCQSKEVKNEIYRLFNDDFFMNEFVHPFPGVLEKLKEWKDKNHTLIIITARNESIRKGTIAMVNRIFPNLIDKIEFVDILESKKCKMLDNKIKVWIDDSLYGIKDAIHLRIPCFLINKEYNASYNEDGSIVTRINNIKDITDEDLFSKL